MFFSFKHMHNFTIILILYRRIGRLTKTDNFRIQKQGLLLRNSSKGYTYGAKYTRYHAYSDALKNKTFPRSYSSPYRWPQPKPGLITKSIPDDKWNRLEKNNLISFWNRIAHTRNCDTRLISNFILISL